MIKQLRQPHLTSLPPPEVGVEGLIGNTPMILIKSLSEYTGNNVYAKLEFMNPGGSAKDRVALAIIRDEEQQGLLKPGDVIFEGTSGSTGISIATVANSLGYKAEIHLPDDTSPDKLVLFDTLGANLKKVKPASIVDPDQYVNSAKNASIRLNNSNTDQHGIFAGQFENDSNWRIHFTTTGPEIYTQLNGHIDYFIAGCGTGGTIAGVSRYLKKKLPGVTTILADPQGSGFYNRVKYGVMYTNEEKEGTRRRHQVDTLVEGIGLNRITHNFSMGEDYIDDSIKVSDEEALKMARFLSVRDGLFIGSSTAINAAAVIKLCKATGIEGKNIVIVACDSGTRHLQKFWKFAVQVPNDITIDDIF
jgi:cysteine synthase A